MTRTSIISEHAHNIRRYTRSETHQDLLSYMRRVKVAILITVAQQDQNGQKN